MGGGKKANSGPRDPHSPRCRWCGGAVVIVEGGETRVLRTNECAFNQKQQDGLENHPTSHALLRNSVEWSSLVYQPCTKPEAQVPHLFPFMLHVDAMFGLPPLRTYISLQTIKHRLIS